MRRYSGSSWREDFARALERAREVAAIPGRYSKAERRVREGGEAARARLEQRRYITEVVEVES